MERKIKIHYIKKILNFFWWELIFGGDLGTYVPDYTVSRPRRPTYAATQVRTLSF
jgi:hypothetical protein